MLTLQRRVAVLEAEKARLADSEQRHRTLFDTIDEGFCVIEFFDGPHGPLSDYVHVEANAAYAKHAGIPDVVGRKLREMVGAEADDWVQRYGEVLRTGVPIRFERELEATGRFLALAAFRIEPASRRQVAVLFQDVTERKRSERALRDSEEQFRVLSQSVPNQVWAARPDGSLYWFNQQVYAYAGVAPGTLDGMLPDSPIVHPDDLSRAGRAWSLALATGAIYETEFRIRRADGAYRWFLSRAEPVRDPDGTLRRWVGTNTDVDDQRRQQSEVAALLEREVAERTRERNRLWETTNDLMGTATLDGRLKSVNPAWSALLGWSEAELLRRPFLEIVDPADHAEIVEVVLRLAAGETVSGFSDRVLTRDGQARIIMWTAVPDPGTALFHIVGRDLTEQRATEAALRQSQKMEAVGQLTGGIAHDFNNLLAGISGSLELIQARLSQGRIGEVDRYVVAAQGAARRAAALTHRLLAFSRRQTLAPKPTDVNRLVTGMEEMIRRTVGPQVTLEVVTAPGRWGTLIDPPQLENALLNLCINARDAMPDGGRITVETANTWLDERGARERDLAPGQYLSVCVSDTGHGMSSDVIARIFDPFFTTKPIGQGTGLGLSMVYGFVRQSGGQVRVYSEVGQGTTMCLYLPRYHVMAPDALPDDPAAEIAQALAGETVLVVDDEPTVRMLVVEVLEDLGYTALEAGDGAAGLRVLQSGVRIDLLVTDVGLPGGMNGRQLADAARVARPSLKVLFITGYAENSVIGHGHLDPGMHILTKPFALDVLAARIRDMIVGAS
ncbi:PAS domain S-box protein [Lichenihabitans sp. Uapishka_5]|uniref:PAS domain S-box protein n=1 Tax=Lichenihabitans sp. Uapishka_5 TaxID=3037302 RepID=UPI0029E7E915|nr:PAS domain S-box protein [Lichenihabitans sp. Uapishka_5]MDX7952412.1 PAS domain S-box protein [Lichenihabitans sp. Uapishka_5]